MRVFQVKPDFSCYSLLPADPQFFAKTGTFPPQSKKVLWEAFGELGPAFYVREPATTKKGSFADAVHGTLAFDASLEGEPIGKILGAAGELLPARLEGDLSSIFILNLLAVHNCFDMERSNYRKAGSVVVQIFEHVFLPEKIGESSLFKIPERKNTDIYTVADRGDPESEFVHQYQKAGLSGLVFEEVWRS